jgi:coenzyme PQQ precursor peptide PqqA
MKIMRPESRLQRFPRRRHGPSMCRGISDSRGAGRPRRHFDAKGNFMQWQTPSATDIRLGFEITMYVAAR